MKQWIMGLCAASLLSCLALALTPPGRVRAVTRMVCGIVCALAMVSPVLELDIDSLAVGMAAYEQQAQSIVGSAEEESKMLERTYIEEACQTYILAKATELGDFLEDASVTARWDDEALVWYPWQVVLTGDYDPTLSRLLEAELGISQERQEWQSNG